MSERDGMAMRRKVLGDAYVDGALARTTPFSAPLQDLLTRVAWGEVWSRPDLDLRTRSCVAIAALVALGRERELAAHVRGGLRNGLTPTEIRELILQCGVYCGMPAAIAAFDVAQRVLDEEEA